MQDQQVVDLTRCDRVRTSLIIAELYQQSFVVELLNNGTNRPASQVMYRNVCQ